MTPTRRSESDRPPPENNDRPLALEDAAGIDLVREALRRASYTAEELQRLLNAPPGTVAVPILDVPVYLRRLSGDGPLPTLARLFLLHAGVPEETARAAFAPLDLARLMAMRLLYLHDQQVRSRFTLVPFEDLYFVSDAYSAERGAVPANHVTGVNPTSVLLSFLTMRRPVEAALDLGTGNGIQALLAARHARHVVATDINARALNVTAFNARLNGFHNVECRQGSFYEPVASETFDLIVSNPPYVISPETRFIFRDGNRPGDAVCAEVARSMPTFLREGGFGHMLGNWVCAPEADWTEPPRRWLERSGCDVLALLHLFEDPLTYAARWLQGDYLAYPAEYGQALDRWLDYYRERDIQALASGALIVRRRGGGSHWFQGHAVGMQTHAPCSEQLGRMFRVQDYCVQTLQSDEALLDCRLRLQENHGLEQIFFYSQGRYKLRSSQLRLLEGQAFPTRIDGLGVELVSGCDGSQTLGNLIQAVAAKYDVPSEEVLPACLASVRNLIVRGFLSPADLT